MASTDITYAYAADITKSAEENGDLMVYGKATGPDLDLDAQRCDPDWLKSAMPQWFDSGANVREQHQNIAAGVGISLNPEDDGWYLKTLVVDPVTKTKVEKGVLKGYSVGIKSARVRTDDSGQEWIVGGNVVEVSLVDRPCLPTATMMIAKSVGGDWTLETSESASKGLSDALAIKDTHERRKAASKAMEAIHKASKPSTPEVHNEQPDIDGGMAAISQICDLIISEAQELKKGRAEEACDIGILMNAIDALQCFVSREAQQGSGDSPMDETTDVALEAVADVEKTADAEEASETEDLFKYVSAKKRKTMAATGQAMPNGDFPIADEGHLKSAVGRLGNYNGNVAKAKKHIIRRAKALHATHLLPSKWGVNGAQERPVDKSETADITKSVDVEDIVKSAVIEAISAQEEIIKNLSADIAEIKTRPIPGGPMLITPPISKAPQSISKAIEYDRIADDAKDPSMRTAYRALAQKTREAE